MPTYVYCVVNQDGTDGEVFEVVQRMSDPPLTTHPETGRPVRQLIQAPNVGGNWTEGSTKSKLSDSNLERLGFAKYQRSEKGVYEKRAGKGPSRLSAD
ncbi:MAG: zinc ribbon domain-containing protein [Phycisphaerales bacterium]|nr:zinc ribbon domain-containing protein [Phycisphaerales bacterium]